LYNPVAENIHYSTKNTKTNANSEKPENEALDFEQFLENHKNDYTYAQKNTLDSLLTQMKGETEEQKKKDAKKRLNKDDFDILDVEKDLLFGRKDLNQGQTIDYSDLSKE
jgi:hypothetical protein